MPPTPGHVPPRPPGPPPTNPPATNPPATEQSGALDFDSTLTSIGQAIPHLSPIVERLRVLGHAMHDALQ